MANIFPKRLDKDDKKKDFLKVKNIENKSEEQLKAIEDRTEKQLKAIKNKKGNNQSPKKLKLKAICNIILATVFTNID